MQRCRYPLREDLQKGHDTLAHTLKNYEPKKNERTSRSRKLSLFDGSTRDDRGKYVSLELLLTRRAWLDLVVVRRRRLGASRDGLLLSVGVGMFRQPYLLVCLRLWRSRVLVPFLFQPRTPTAPCTARGVGVRTVVDSVVVVPIGRSVGRLRLRLRMGVGSL